MKRIFLSGPMSDLPDLNYPAFHAAAAALRADGYHVESPAENPRQESWEAYMALSLAQMLTCEEVYLLPGWELGSGAVIEASVAARLGKPLKRFYDQGDGEFLALLMVDRGPGIGPLIPLPAPGALRRSA